ncbi:hypothetical protein DB30_04151 [Enhygromyxa salina]|uniref:Uncharacterized protein n=1 Tax=Enhygromyxa salina TaxID=215803 RepID=A0A0C2DA88_9BACT|nr:hypothetical protein DB30_04151 [Enhygromyxa salina]
MLTAISRDNSQVAYGYNERGAQTVDCKHRGSSTATPAVRTSRMA